MMVEEIERERVAPAESLHGQLINYSPSVAGAGDRPPMSVPETQSAVPEFDPLLKDLAEKKQSFRQNVASLAAELKEARGRLASQEHSFARENLTRQDAERKVKKMEEEICRLEKRLEERNGQLQASASAVDKYLEEADALRLQIASSQATADKSAALAQSVQLQVLALLKELDVKNCSLEEHEECVNLLGKQLDNLQRDLQARETSQNQLKDQVGRMENDIMQTLAKAGMSKDPELRKMLNEIAPKNIETIDKKFITKDAEVGRLREEVKIMSAHWMLKTEELESQLEKQRRADQELKKRVLKLEFCLQEARSQTRKLQRTGNKRDKALKELRDQLSTKQQHGSPEDNSKQNFWETPCFKIVVSMSMVVLVVFSRR